MKKLLSVLLAVIICMTTVISGLGMVFAAEVADNTNVFRYGDISATGTDGWTMTNVLGDNTMSVSDGKLVFQMPEADNMGHLSATAKVEPNTKYAISYSADVVNASITTILDELNNLGNSVQTTAVNNTDAFSSGNLATIDAAAGGQVLFTFTTGADTQYLKLTIQQSATAATAQVGYSNIEIIKNPTAFALKLDDASVKANGAVSVPLTVVSNPGTSKIEANVAISGATITGFTLAENTGYTSASLANGILTVTSATDSTFTGVLGYFAVQADNPGTTSEADTLKVTVDPAIYSGSGTSGASNASGKVVCQTSSSYDATDKYLLASSTVTVAEQFTFRLGDADAATGYSAETMVGEDFSLPLYIDSNPGIAEVIISMDLPEGITFDSIDDSLIDGLTVTCDKGTGDNHYVITIEISDISSFENVTDTGLLTNINFKTSGTADPDKEYDVKLSAVDGNIIDIDDEEIANNTDSTAKVDLTDCDHIGYLGNYVRHASGTVETVKYTEADWVHVSYNFTSATAISRIDLLDWGAGDAYYDNVSVQAVAGDGSLGNNVIVNGGFESGFNGWVDLSTTAGFTGSASASSAEAKTGTGSLKTNFAWVGQAVSLAAGTYQISYDLYIPSSVVGNGAFAAWVNPGVTWDLTTAKTTTLVEKEKQVITGGDYAADYYETTCTNCGKTFSTPVLQLAADDVTIDLENDASVSHDIPVSITGVNPGFKKLTFNISTTSPVKIDSIVSNLAGVTLDVTNKTDNSATVTITADTGSITDIGKLFTVTVSASRNSDASKTDLVITPVNAGCIAADDTLFTTVTADENEVTNTDKTFMRFIQTTQPSVELVACTHSTYTWTVDPNNSLVYNKICDVCGDIVATKTVLAIEAGSGTLEAGQEVTVPVKITNNPGFGELIFSLDVDSSIKLTDIKNGDGDYKFTVTDSNPSEKDGKTHYVVIVDSATLDENDEFTGVLMNLVFTTDAHTTSGTYPLTISFDANNMVDIDGNELVLKGDGTSPDVSQVLTTDGEIIVTDCTHTHGSTWTHVDATDTAPEHYERKCDVCGTVLETADILTIDAGEVEMEAHHTAQVPVTITGINPGFGELIFAIDVDSTVKITGVSAGDVELNSFEVTDSNPSVVNGKTHYVVIADSEDISQNVTDTGIMLNLTVTTDAKAPAGTYSIDMSAISANMLDADGSELTIIDPDDDSFVANQYTFVSGSVKVIDCTHQDTKTWTKIDATDTAPAYYQLTCDNCGDILETKNILEISAVDTTVEAGYSSALDVKISGINPGFGEMIFSMAIPEEIVLDLDKITFDSDDVAITVVKKDTVNGITNYTVVVDANDLENGFTGTGVLFSIPVTTATSTTAAGDYNVAFTAESGNMVAIDLNELTIIDPDDDSLIANQYVFTDGVIKVEACTHANSTKTWTKLDATDTSPAYYQLTCDNCGVVLETKNILQISAGQVKLKAGETTTLPVTITGINPGFAELIFSIDVDSSITINSVSAGGVACTLNVMDDTNPSVKDGLTHYVVVVESDDIGTAITATGILLNVEYTTPYTADSAVYPVTLSATEGNVIDVDGNDLDIIDPDDETVFAHQYEFTNGSIEVTECQHEGRTTWTRIDATDEAPAYYQETCDNCGDIIATQNILEISAENVIAKAGEEVAVQFTINGINPGFGELIFAIDVADDFEIVSVTAGDVASGNTYEVNAANPTVKDGSLHYVAIVEDSLDENITDTGLLLTVTYKAPFLNSDVDTVFPVKLSMDKDNAVDIDGESLVLSDGTSYVELTDGSITVAGCTHPDESNGYKLTTDPQWTVRGYYTIYCTLCDKVLSDDNRTYLLGDLNNDGIQNAKDILILRRELVGLYQFSWLQSLSANCDQVKAIDGSYSVNSVDLVALRKYVVSES